MTTLDILGGDWRINFDDENVNAIVGQAGLRSVEYITGVRRTLNQIYSAVAENASFFQAMTFKNPMTPTTPNAYVMANNYFMSRASMEQTFEGAVNASWALTLVGTDSGGHGVLKVAYTGGTGPVTGDVGRRITQADSTDTGTLLAFDQDPDGTTIAWIRPDDSTPVTGDLFDGTGALTATGGTMSTTSSTAGISGDTQWSAIQAIGAVPTASEVYVVQDRIKQTSFDGTFQWWATDPALSLGIISIAIMVQNSGVTIADGDVEVFARRYTSLYDNFRLNVIAGGFQALPLASAPDINNTTGYRRTVLSGASGTWDVGNGIYVGATWATATARGVITAGGSGATPTIEYYIVGDLTDLSAATVTEYDFVTAADGDATGTAGAPSANLLGPTDPAAGEGGTVTLTLGAVTTVDFDGDGTAEDYSITTDAQGDVSVAKVYERFKYVTRRGATAADLFGAGTNVPGETYRGNEGTFYYDAPTSTMNDGEDLAITATTNFSARLTAQNTTPAAASQAYIVMMDVQTSLTSAQPANNDLISDEGGDGVRDVTVDTAGAGGSILRYTVSKQSPLGTFTGTQLFLSRGNIIVNPASADTQAYKATPDDSTTPLDPPNTIAVGFANTRALDRLMVARDTGVSGVINRDQFGGLATPAGSYNSQGDVLIRVAGTTDSEVTLASVVRVVETTLIEEHRYYYDSVTKQALGEFTLTVPTADTGSATTASTTQVIDSVGGFQGATPVQVGMLVRNTFAGKTAHVWEITNVVDDTTIDVRQLYGPMDVTQDWDIGDTYEINKLIQTYATSDNIFDLILDVEEGVGTDGTPGSETNNIIKLLAADFGVVAEARQGKIILPFTLNQTIGDNAVTMTIVRQADSIAT